MPLWQPKATTISATVLGRSASFGPRVGWRHCDDWLTAQCVQKEGVFRLGRTIVGTLAFVSMRGNLRVRYGFDPAAQTNDIDIARFERLSLVRGRCHVPALGQGVGPILNLMPFPP